MNFRKVILLLLLQFFIAPAINKKRKKKTEKEVSAHSNDTLGKQISDGFERKNLTLTKDEIMNTLEGIGDWGEFINYNSIFSRLIFDAINRVGHATTEKGTLVIEELLHVPLIPNFLPNHSKSILDKGSEFTTIAEDANYLISNVTIPLTLNFIHAKVYDIQIQDIEDISKADLFRSVPAYGNQSLAFDLAVGKLTVTATIKWKANMGPFKPGAKVKARIKLYDLEAYTVVTLPIEASKAQGFQLGQFLEIPCIAQLVNNVSMPVLDTKVKAVKVKFKGFPEVKTKRGGFLGDLQSDLVKEFSKSARKMVRGVVNGREQNFEFFLRVESSKVVESNDLRRPSGKLGWLQETLGKDIQDEETLSPDTGSGEKSPTGALSECQHVYKPSSDISTNPFVVRVFMGIFKFDSFRVNLVAVNEGAPIFLNSLLENKTCDRFPSPGAPLPLLPLNTSIFAFAQRLVVNVFALRTSPNWGVNGSIFFSLNDLFDTILGTHGQLNIRNLFTLSENDDRRPKFDLTLTNLQVNGLSSFTRFDFYTLSLYEWFLAFRSQFIDARVNVYIDILYPPGWFNNPLNTGLPRYRKELSKEDLNGELRVIENVTLGIGVKNASNSFKLGLNVSKPMLDGLGVGEIFASPPCALRPVRNASIANLKAGCGEVTPHFQCIGPPEKDHCTLPSFQDMNTTWTSKKAQMQFNNVMHDFLALVSKQDDSYQYGSAFCEGATHGMQNSLNESHKWCKGWRPKGFHSSNWLGDSKFLQDLGLWLSVGFAGLAGLAFLVLPWIYGWGGSTAKADARRKTISFQSQTSKAYSEKEEGGRTDETEPLVHGGVEAVPEMSSSSNSDVSWQPDRKKRSPKTVQFGKDTDTDQPEAEASANEAKFPCLANHEAVAVWVRFVIPLLLIANVALIVSGTFGLAATVYASAKVAGFNLRFNVQTFTIFNSLTKTWQAGVWVLTILTAVSCIFWPYFKIFVQFCCWYVPPRYCKSRARGRILEMIDFMGKWVFSNTFILTLMMIAFQVHIDNSDTWPNVLFLPKDFFILDLWVWPEYSLYVFTIAAIANQMLTTGILHLHRQAAATDYLPSDARSAAQNLELGNLSPFSKKHFGDKKGALVNVIRDPLTEATRRSAADIVTNPRISLANHKFVSEKGFAEITGFGKWTSFIFLLASVGCLIGGGFVPIVKFEFTGLAALALGDQVNRTYSLFSMGSILLPTYFKPTAGMWFIYIVFIFFAYIFPVLFLICIILLWIVPFSLREQRWMHVTCEMMNRWQALDVFVVAVIVTGLSIEIFVKMLIGEKCWFLNEFLEVFQEMIKLDEPTCFSSKCILLGGLGFLIFAAVFIIALGHLTLGLSRIALQDRTFHPEDPKLKIGKMKFKHAKLKFFARWWRDLFVTFGFIRIIEHDHRSTMPHRYYKSSDQSQISRALATGKATKTPGGQNLIVSSFQAHHIADQNRDEAPHTPLDTSSEASSKDNLFSTPNFSDGERPNAMPSSAFKTAKESDRIPSSAFKTAKEE